MVQNNSRDDSVRYIYNLLLCHKTRKGFMHISLLSTVVTVLAMKYVYILGYLQHRKYNLLGTWKHKSGVMVPKNVSGPMTAWKQRHKWDYGIYHVHFL